MLTPVCKHGGHPGPPLLGPGLRQQRGADGPFAADAQRRQKAEDQQLPPGLREERQAGEQRIGQDRQDQRPAAAQQIAHPAEETAAQRPAHEKRGLNPRAFLANQRVGRAGDAQQVHDERRGHKRVEVHVQAVEQPAEPRGDAGFPLLRRDVTQTCHITLGD